MDCSLDVFFGFIVIYFYAYCTTTIGFGDLCEKEFGASRDGSDPVRCELCVLSPGFKREIFPKFRTAVGGARVRLPVDVECREDLHEMQDVVKGDAHNYFAKRTAEGHSDRCTAAALGYRASASFVHIPPFSAGRRHTYDLRRI